MLKKTIQYNDFDGNPQSEDCYFNLTKAELAELELRHNGGLAAYLQTVIDAKDGKEIIGTFKEIIGLAYGKRSEDGKRFTKTADQTEEFFSTEAYSELFMELMTDTGAAVEFIKAILPADLVKLAAQTVQGEKVEDKSVVEGEIVGDSWTRKPTNQLTLEELITMPKAEFDKLSPSDMSRHQLLVAMNRKMKNQ